MIEIGKSKHKSENYSHWLAVIMKGSYDRTPPLQLRLNTITWRQREQVYKKGLNHTLYRGFATKTQHFRAVILNRNISESNKRILSSWSTSLMKQICHSPALLHVPDSSSSSLLPLTSLLRWSFCNLSRLKEAILSSLRLDFMLTEWSLSKLTTSLQC